MVLGANNKDAEQIGHTGNLICALIIRTLPTDVYKEGYCTQHGIMALEKVVKNLWYISVDYFRGEKSQLVILVERKSTSDFT